METLVERIVLIGFMGTGKSAVGKLLAEKLNWQFFDTDTEIVKRTGREIKEIFEKEGEAFFRKLEAEVVQSVNAYKGAVIATGGGTAVSVPEFIKTPGTLVVYLQTSFSRLCERLRGDTSRPLFRDVDMASQLYLTREPRYSELADINIDETDLNLEEVTAKLYEIVREKI